ncbi:MAG: winged helix-turn-helix domain-containing protein, partial [Myxococcota bacterium]
MDAGFRWVTLSDGTVDLGRELVTRRGQVTPLTTREAALIAYLAARPGEAVSRQQLHVDVWGYAASVVSRTVDTTVRRLRAKIEVDPAQPAHLQTVHGQGYRFQPLQAGGAARVGRDRELAAVTAAWADRPRLGVVGPPGVGKSLLLRELAERLRAAGRDVAWLDAPTPAPPGPLAVVDDVAPDDLATVARWPGRVLFAARERRPVPGLAWIELGPLPAADAATLFLARAREAEPGWDAAPAALQAIVDRLDRLPGALEAAAARAHVLPADAMRAHAAGRRAALPALPPDQRDVLARLAAFEGPFDLEAAEAVVDRPDALVDALTALR